MRSQASSFRPAAASRYTVNLCSILQFIARIALGISRTFQQIATFPSLTCRDNVLIGLGRNAIPAVLRRSFDGAVAGPVSRTETERADAALDAVGLNGYGDIRASALSLGNQRRLEIARAIVSRPRLILLDEPVSGVSHDEAAQLSQLLQSINRELGITNADRRAQYRVPDRPYAIVLR